jgi:protease-4
LKIKLVDQLGGLDEAVKKAAELAKVEEYYTDSYPAKADFMDTLLKASGEAGDNYLNSQLRATLGEYYEPFMLMKKLDKQNAIQARVPFYFNIK